MKTYQAWSRDLDPVSVKAETSVEAVEKYMLDSTEFDCSEVVYVKLPNGDVFKFVVSIATRRVATTEFHGCVK